MIYYLAIKSCTGNKRAKGELVSIIIIHEEQSVEDIRSPMKVRRNEGKIRYYKEGWIEEIENNENERH